MFILGENKMGLLIAELRKEKQLTQKDLAAQLRITDKAVSKWERGLSCPDIALLAPLANILGVSPGELLNGQRSETISQTVEETVDSALVYAAESTKRTMISFQNILAASFSLLILLGIVICSICDLAISGTFTWSLYPISASIFAWLLFIPLVKSGSKGIFASLISLSIFIIPFLSVISKLTGISLLMPIGITVSIVSIVYIWLVYLIFKKMKTRKTIAAACSLLLAIPLCLAINFTLSQYISEPLFDVWDALSFGIILLVSVVLFVIDYSKRQKRR